MNEIIGVGTPAKLCVEYFSSVTFTETEAMITLENNYLNSRCIFAVISGGTRDAVVMRVTGESSNKAYIKLDRQPNGTLPITVWYLA